MFAWSWMILHGVQAMASAAVWDEDEESDKWGGVEVSGSPIIL